MSTSPQEDTYKVFDKVEGEVKSDDHDQYKREEFSTEHPDNTAKLKSTSPEEDIKKLKVIYDSVEDMVKCDDYDTDLQKELSIEYPNYMNVLESAKRDLLRNDCGIVVAGETSSGKSTLVSTLVGPVGKKTLFKSAILAATAVITRIRNSDELYIKAYTKDEVLIKEERFDNRKALRSAIQKLSDMEKMSADMKKGLHFLDVYLPVPILKGNIIIVDTPGVGENKTLDLMLIDFLQHAVAFVFVVNCRNAGGISGDRDSIEQDATPQYSSDSDSSEEESEVELVWKKVKMKITDIWGELPLKNIFQISLKQVKEGIASKYTEEYKRFEEKLNKTIAINKDKRVQIYFDFIQRFHKTAIRGTLARLTRLGRSEEEHKKIMTENMEKIYQLEKDCKERRRQMQQCKKELVEELSKKLKGYLESPSGKNEILNPPGESGIDQVSLRNVDAEVSRRIKNGINRWCKNDEAQAILGKADIMIKDHLGFIESQIMSIEIGLLGFHAVMAVGISGVLLDLGFTIGLIAFPLSVVFAIAVAFVLAPMLVVYGWFKGAEYVLEKANKNYTTIVSQISLIELERKFDDSIGKEFDKVISEIFDDAVPKKIQSFLTISIKLQDEYNDIKEKQDSLKRMKCRIDDIGKKIEEFKSTRNSL